MCVCVCVRACVCVKQIKNKDAPLLNILLPYFTKYSSDLGHPPLILKL